MMRMAALFAILAACSGASATIDDNAAQPTATIQATRGANMDIVYRDLADPGWRHAAQTAIADLNSRMAQWGVARVVIFPWRSEDGAVVPYMFRLEPYRADGSPAFFTTVLLVGDKVVNGGGAPAASGFLASAGFPVKRISLGHVLDALYLANAIDPSWIEAPSMGLDGWGKVGRPSPTTGLAPALEYTADGAVLHLFRVQVAQSAPSPGPSIPGMPPIGGGGGGYTAPVPERLDVTFDRHARFTSTVLHRDPGTGAWHPVS